MATTATTTRGTQNGTRGEGRGRVLAAAFDEAERQPALQEGRDQALEQVNRGAPPHEVAGVVESDVGLTCAIVRAAGQLQGGGRIRSVADGIERLGPGAVEAVLRAAPAYDIFNGDGRLALAPDRFRLHALDVRQAGAGAPPPELRGALRSPQLDPGRENRRGATRAGHRSRPRRRSSHPTLGRARTRGRVNRAPPHSWSGGCRGGASLRRHGRRAPRGLSRLDPGPDRGRRALWPRRARGPDGRLRASPGQGVTSPCHRPMSPLLAGA